MSLQQYEFVSWAERKSSKRKVQAHLLRRYHASGASHNPAEATPDVEQSSMTRGRTALVPVDYALRGVITWPPAIEIPATNLSDMFTTCGVEMSLQERRLVHHCKLNPE